MSARQPAWAFLPRGHAIPLPGDPTFNLWATAGLQWLPEQGMGYYPVREQPYDAAYFRKYQEYEDTELGRAITEYRVALVQRHHATWCETLVDVGIGSGAFVKAIANVVNEVRGYDINPAGVSWLNERALFVDPRVSPAGILTFWDALEHIPDAHEFIASAKRWVFCSLPIFTGPEHVLRSKHYRKDEHCWYWTRTGLIRWMAAQGFQCVENNAAESLLGREDIESFAFRRAGDIGGLHADVPVAVRYSVGNACSPSNPRGGRQ